MTSQHKLVFDLIQECNKRITQLQISKTAEWIGSHPEHEAHLKIDHQQTTLRKVRQLINDLRHIYGCHILSDLNGYWVSDDLAEVQEFITRLEKTAKAQAKSWFATYKTMKKIYNIRSDYFDTQQSLFDE
jgi:ABC-type hemin transport system ATPase subunit